MKKIIFIILFTCVSFLSFGQNSSLGVFLGTSYYNGDMNKYLPLNPPAPSFGVLYAHDLDYKTSLRFFVNKGTLKGKADTLNNAFKTEIYDLGFMIEINMIKFSYSNSQTKKISPFIEFGAAILLVPQAQGSINFSIPFGAGIKYALSDKSTILFEWNYHITNTDELDLIKLENPTNTINPIKMINNDWYSFVGIAFRYKLFKQDRLCPAYW